MTDQQRKDLSKGKTSSRHEIYETFVLEGKNDKRNENWKLDFYSES